MNQQQFDAFLIRSQDSWERMETYRQAYVAEADTLAKKSNKLKWSTIAVGFLTGVCSIPVLLEIPATEYVVAMFGVLTGSLTLIDKHFRWEELSSQAWTNQKALDALQRDLYNFTVDVGHSIANDDPSLFIQQINEKAEKYTTLRVNKMEQWSNRAKEAMQSHGISSVQLIDTDDHQDEPEEFLTDDAVGIVAVTRG